MPVDLARAAADTVVVRSTRVRIDVQLRPFCFTVSRGGRSLVRAGGLWAVEGTAHDQFIASPRE